MIRDDERREVAHRMREFDVSEFKESAIVPILECLGIGNVNWRGVLDRLADLIDRPTCRNIGDDYMFKCSECGAEFEPVTVNGNEYGEVFYTQLKPLYCSACGAEVVE